jgi:Rrf2 family protein
MIINLYISNLKIIYCLTINDDCFIFGQKSLNSLIDMPVFSNTCNYALRAAFYVASNSEQKFVTIRQIATNLGISFHFLTKILQILTQQKIMNSYRGPNGGVSLAKPANEITVLDIVRAIEGDKLFDGCIIGLPGCGEKEPCPLHDQWMEVKEKLEMSFQNQTLDKLSREIINFGLRLTE